MIAPSLLYVSPVVPALTGNGLAMRAGMVLQSLAPHHRVSLLVVPLYPPYPAEVPAALVQVCDRVVVLTPQPIGMTRRGLRDRFLGRQRHGQPRAFKGMTFDVVHVFRLAAVPFARHYLQRSSMRRLDLDDIESLTHQRLAALYRLNGDEMRAEMEERLAGRYLVLEGEVLPQFDRVYVCSDADSARLRARSPVEVCTLPNAVRLPARVERKLETERFTFLFAGTLGYYPNEDAARYFCREVLPILREMAPLDVDVTIVGNAPSDEVRRLEGLSGVRVIGSVPGMEPWYRDADAVIVPIRAGGGTRIKVLEAFSYRRPVVSTTLGVEGIEARHEEHLLIGDSPEAFAAQCRRVMTDAPLADALVENAFSLVARSYAFGAAEDQEEPSQPYASPTS